MRFDGAKVRLLVLCLLLHSSTAFRVRPQTQAKSKLSPPRTKRPTDSDDEPSKLGPVLSGASLIFYGLTMLLYSNECPGQIHIITMMRATGYNKIEEGIRKLRRNIRDAIWSAIRNLPSLYKFKRSMRSSERRIRDLKRISEQTKKAKEDGVITPREARAIERLRQKEIKRYQNELQNIVNLTSTIRKIWAALDIQEIQYVLREFLFQTLAVLSTGNDQGYVGRFISRWCLFLNLGNTFLDINSKLRFPIARSILRLHSSDELTRKRAKKVETMGQMIMFSTAGYLTVRHTTTAQHLNAACMSAAILYRGVRRLVRIFYEIEGKKTKSVWSSGNNVFDRPAGGMVMIFLSIIGMFCRHSDNLKLPDWLVPFWFLEDAIHRIVVVMDKVL